MTNLIGLNVRGTGVAQLIIQFYARIIELSMYILLIL